MRSGTRQPAASGPDHRALVEPERLRQELAAIEPAARAPDAVRIVRAPGRVNLIGEHTDYNDGFVLPVAIDLDVRIAFVPTRDRRVELTSAATGRRSGFELDAIGPPTGGWIDYVAGTAGALLGAGAALHGLRGLVAGSLPSGAGLSSSAALELAAAWALLDPPDPASHGLDGMALALAAQRAENEHVGVRVGLMDQFASALGRAGAALFLDCRSLDWRPVALPLAEHALVVCHSGSPRRLEASAYNERRAQCERAVELIARARPGVRALRDVDRALLGEVADRLDEVTRRRCEHVVDENERVLDAVIALETGDLGAVGRLFAASHASLRDRYEVSSPALDALVDIASAVDGVVAARMTGAGFGGCTVNLVRRDAVDDLRAAVENRYPARTGLRPRVFAVEPAAGAGLLAGPPGG